ncbi:hypothetical protein [Ensifer sp. R-19]|uniref:hypothetical protein n=1 Tax=Ensifer sp. R-19 TaxID=3404055 RepID=UPI003CEE3125
MKLTKLVAALLICGVPNTLHARDIGSVSTISIKIDTKASMVTYASSGPHTYVGSYPQTIVLERLKVGGETLWSIGYFSTGCNIDGRFSIVSALFKIGQSHVEKVKCSSVADNEAGSIVAQAKGEFAGNVLSVSSTITEDIMRDGIRTKAKTTEVIKVDLSKGCTVRAAKVSSDKLATAQNRKVTADTLRTTNFSKRCETYPR